MSSAESTVFAGVVPPDATALNKVEHALPPLDSVHDARIFASVFSLSTGTVRVDGSPVPGAAPVAGFTN